MLAAYLAAAHTPSPATIATDSKYVVDNWKKHITDLQPWKPNADHQDLWQPLTTLITHLNTLTQINDPYITIRKVKGHATEQDIRQNSITEADKDGNHAADALATQALHAHPAKTINIKGVAALRAITVWTQVMMLTLVLRRAQCMKHDEIDNLQPTNTSNPNTTKTRSNRTEHP